MGSVLKLEQQLGDNPPASELAALQNFSQQPQLLELTQCYLDIVSNKNMRQQLERFGQIQLPELSPRIFIELIVRKGATLGYKEQQLNFDEITRNIEQQLIQKIPDLNEMGDNVSICDSADSKSISKIVQKDEIKTKSQDLQFEGIMQMMKSQKFKSNIFEKMQDQDTESLSKQPQGAMPIELTINKNY